ncbi:hypothetical protein D3C78_992510 [compost metagenome]
MRDRSVNRSDAFKIMKMTSIRKWNGIPCSSPDEMGVTIVKGSLGVVHVNMRYAGRRRLCNSSVFMCVANIKGSNARKRMNMNRSSVP